MLSHFTDSGGLVIEAVTAFAGCRVQRQRQLIKCVTATTTKKRHKSFLNRRVALCLPLPQRNQRSEQRKPTHSTLVVSWFSSFYTPMTVSAILQLRESVKHLVRHTVDYQENNFHISPSIPASLSLPKKTANKNCREKHQGDRKEAAWLSWWTD